MTPRELAAYAAKQLAGLDEIRYIAMMGGYIFYYRERIFGGIYEKGFMVKDTEAARRAMPEAEPAPPYEGARPMLPLSSDILEDGDAFRRMVFEMFDELPPKKMKKR